MDVIRFSNIEELQVHAATWNRLAACVPFRSWAWLATWWRHYAASGNLFVLGAFEHGELVGIAPWYRTLTVRHGRTLRLLGDTEVCSEYGTILCRRGLERTVAGALAAWLVSARGPDRWDVVELHAADPDDEMPTALSEAMAARGCRLHVRPGMGCWRVALPATWDEFLDRFSKERRKRVRRLQRRFVDSGLAVWRTAQTPEQLAAASALLIDLHQRRRNALGEPGCFSWPRYRAFHEEVWPQLLGERQLGLSWVELEGRPVAAEYHLLGDDVVYCYQGGIAPEEAEVSPGQIATLFAVREAIGRGYKAFDFLRGDELYKQQWQATLRPSLEMRIVANRTAAQLRHGIWRTGLEVKRLITSAIGSTRSA